MKKKRKKITRLWRNCKAWFIRLDRRQRRAPLPAPADQTQHHCRYCGTDFSGRRCPQCGLAANWQRFTLKNALRGFMNIWGLGERSIFSTMKDLLWRPGYLMSDYLSGHHLSYFPPFKLLALLVTFFTAVTMLLNVPLHYDSSGLEEHLQTIVFKGQPLTVLAPTLCHAAARVFSFFDEHLLYRFLLLNVVITLAAWRVFHKAKQYNLTETFISQIYINCQFFLLAIISVILTRSYSLGTVFPYMVSDKMVFFVLLYDYYQLYGLGFKKTFWRLILMFFVVYVIFLTIFLCLIIPILLYIFSIGAI